MAIADNFFAAAYPEPWQILGVKVRPFSLGHYIKLSRLGCAFVSEKETTATLADLILGVIVCSMPTTVDPSADPFWQWMNRKSGGWKYFFYKHRKILMGKKFATPAEYEVFLWGKKMGAIDFAQKVKMFSAYMDSHSAMPAYVEERPDSQSKPSGAHWSQSVLSSLVSKCGYTMEEALNAPVSRALSDFLKQAESDGAVRLIPSEALA